MNTKSISSQYRDFANKINSESLDCLKEMSHSRFKDCVSQFKKFHLGTEASFNHFMFEKAHANYKFLERLSTYFLETKSGANNIYSEAQHFLGPFPSITDDLISLGGQIALDMALENSRWCERRYGYGPHSCTSEEKSFIINDLQNYFKTKSNKPYSNHSLKIRSIPPHAPILSSNGQTVLSGKLPIACYFPDSIVLKAKYKSANSVKAVFVIFEIDGVVHEMIEGKAIKDNLMSEDMQRIGIHVYSIPNSIVSRKSGIPGSIPKTLKETLSSTKKHTESKTIINQLRKIHLINIACWLGLEGFSKLIESEVGTQIDLVAIRDFYLKHPSMRNALAPLKRITKEEKVA